MLTRVLDMNKLILTYKIIQRKIKDIRITRSNVDNPDQHCVVFDDLTICASHEVEFILGKPFASIEVLSFWLDYTMKNLFCILNIFPIFRYRRSLNSVVLISAVLDSAVFFQGFKSLNRADIVLE